MISSENIARSEIPTKCFEIITKRTQWISDRIRKILLRKNNLILRQKIMIIKNQLKVYFNRPNEKAKLLNLCGERFNNRVNKVSGQQWRIKNLKSNINFMDFCGRQKLPWESLCSTIINEIIGKKFRETPDVKENSLTTWKLKLRQRKK